MEKKIPKVFANKIDHDLRNNEQVYYSFNNKEKNKKDYKPDIPLVKGTTIMQKLKSIFSSPIFVYKAKVDIVTDEGTITKEIVGYNKTHIMTMNDELIPISKIKDIYFSK